MLKDVAWDCRVMEATLANSVFSKMWEMGRS